MITIIHSVLLILYKSIEYSNAFNFLGFQLEAAQWWMKLKHPSFLNIDALQITWCRSNPVEYVDLPGLLFGYFAVSIVLQSKAGNTSASSQSQRILP